MKRLLALALIPATVLASECVLQDRTVSRSTVTIAERSKIKPEVVPSVNNGRKCMVTFRVRIGADWHSAHGEYEWAGDRPREEACTVAVKRAEDEVRERVGRLQTVSEKTMVCSDRPDLDALRSTNPGTIAELHQFRPHPDHPREFWHNGAPCRYFLDSAYVRQDVRTFQGVICRIHESKWVVVDKW
jgi:hypothetical protein